jgi:hypothetical protein
VQNCAQNSASGAPLGACGALYGGTVMVDAQLA